MLAEVAKEAVDAFLDSLIDVCDKVSKCVEMNADNLHGESGTGVFGNRSW